MIQRRSLFILSLIIGTYMVLATPPAEANRLKGSDTAYDALIVQRGTATYSKGDFGSATQLDTRGRIALKTQDAPTSLSGGKAWYGEYVSAPVDLPFPALEFLPSWNVEFNPLTEGFAFDLRLRWQDRTGKAAWSDWYHIAADGIDDPSQTALHLKDDNAKLDDDYLLTTPHAVAMQWRWRVWRSATLKPDTAPRHAPRLRLVTIAASDPHPPGVVPDQPAGATANHTASGDLDPTLNGVSLRDFPWRSQIMGTRIDGKICCATSVNMVLQYYGKPEPLLDSTQRCYDRRLHIYGSWPRAAQVLSEAGVDAWIERFRTLDETRHYLEKGIPVVMSIKARRGQLFSAPYSRTGGHVIVLRGFDKDGNPLLSDPGTHYHNKGYTHWTPKELETVWIGNGGVGMVAAPRNLGFPKPYVRRLGKPSAKP